MADYVNPSTCKLALSVDAMPSPWLVIARDSAHASVCTRKFAANLLAKMTAAGGQAVFSGEVEAIPPQYRKWVTDHVEVMTAPEQATVDAAAAIAAETSRAVGFDVESPFGVFRSVIKPATTTRTGTTTLVSDPDLKFAIEAGAKYIFEFRIFFDTTAAADFKLALDGPVSPAGVRFRRWAIAPGATALSAIGVSTAYGGGGIAITGTGTTGGFAEGHGIISNGANAGNVAIQWAQNTSDVGNTSVLQGSMLWWSRIG